MQLTPAEPPQRRSTLAGRLGRYALATGVACAVAAIVGEVFFPAELEGDTGGNDFAGLAASAWAFATLVLCVVAVVACEVYLRAGRHRDDNGD
jgi:hypothetical protein